MNSLLNDLSGMKIGKLTVLSFAKRGNWKHITSDTAAHGRKEIDSARLDELLGLYQKRKAELK